MSKFTKDDMNRVKNRIDFLKKSLAYIYLGVTIFYLCAFVVAYYFHLNEAFATVIIIFAFNMLFLTGVDENVKKFRRWVREADKTNLNDKI